MPGRRAQSNEGKHPEEAGVSSAAVHRGRVLNRYRRHRSVVLSPPCRKRAVSITTPTVSSTAVPVAATATGAEVTTRAALLGRVPRTAWSISYHSLRPSLGVTQDVSDLCPRDRGSANPAKSRETAISRHDLPVLRRSTSVDLTTFGIAQSAPNRGSPRNASGGGISSDRGLRSSGCARKSGH